METVFQRLLIDFLPDFCRRGFCLSRVALSRPRRAHYEVWAISQSIIACRECIFRSSARSVKQGSGLPSDVGRLYLGIAASRGGRAPSIQPLRLPRVARSPHTGCWRKALPGGFVADPRPVPARARARSYQAELSAPDYQWAALLSREVLMARLAADAAVFGKSFDKLAKMKVVRGA